LVSLNRRRVDDAAARAQVGQRKSAEPEHGEARWPIGPLELFSVERLEVGARHLVRRVVDEDVQPAEAFRGCGDEVLAVALVSDDETFAYFWSVELALPANCR
jgi:hypothetical protein